MQYFYGPDTYGAREAIHSASRRMAESDNIPIRWVDREDLDQQSLAPILDQAGSGLFGGQLVVVRDASSFPKALQEQVIECAKTASSTEWVVWDREDPDKRSKLFKTLKPFGTAFPVLSPAEVATWAGSTFPDVEPTATQELARRCSLDRWRITNEVARLSLRHQPITRQVVEAEVPPVEAADEIFPFLDAIASAHTQRAVQLLNGLLAAGNSELYILSMLGYQFKTLLAIAAGQADGLHPYVIQKNKPAARRYSVQQLQNILARLAATDFAIKQGKVDQRTALVMLVLSFGQPASA